MAEPTGHETATHATTPFYIWASHVTVKAVRSGATPESCAAVPREKLRRWYDAGEPVWMAADALKQLARGVVLAEREDKDSLHVLLRPR